MAGLTTKQNGGRGSSLLGSLRDALAAASGDDGRRNKTDTPARLSPASGPTLDQKHVAAMKDVTDALPQSVPPTLPAKATPATAAVAAARSPTPAAIEEVSEEPPATRILNSKSDCASRSTEDAAPRTQIIRGKPKLQRGQYEQDPVVGWLVVVGGPGLGSYRPVFEGNNAVGRGPDNRIKIDFGDESISQSEQAYIRYDSADRSFLFVPNLAKTNVVAINESRPAQPQKLKAMDLITMGRTQLVFVPFCGAEFDWGDLGHLGETNS